MVKIFSTKTISGNPSDAMDTTFFSIFSRFSKNEAVYYAEASEDFVEAGAIKKYHSKAETEFRDS